MSYAAVGNVGSYYTFRPGQVYNGAAGFGAIEDEFNANQVWSDVQLGASCFPPGVNQNIGQCNAAGMRATKMIQSALNALGYGPLAVDGNWSTASPRWKQYMNQHKLSTAVGLVQKNGLVLMEDLLRKGAKPGPAAKKTFKKVNGEFIPVTEEDDGVAGIGLGVVALLVVGAAGAVAVARARKKKKKTPTRMARTI